MPDPDLPRVLVTAYHLATGLHADLAGPGPWELSGPDSRIQAGHGQAFTTWVEGPVTESARRQLARAYPQVVTWQARPAKIDETYTGAGSLRGANRIAELLGVHPRTANAILTIAADDALGHRFVHGQWEITGDDDEQSFRIRDTSGDDPGEDLVGRAESFARTHAARIGSQPL